MNNSNESNSFSYFLSEDGEEVSDDSSQDNVIDLQNLAPLREQDRFLPICNIVKIMKKAIPEKGKIAKDARECIQECVSEFISFITSEAIDKSHSENRKTVNGDDLLFAMNVLGFDNYVEPLMHYLHKYRESTKSDRNLVYNETAYYEDSSRDFRRRTDEEDPALLNSFPMENPIVYCQNSEGGNFNL